MIANYDGKRPCVNCTGTIRAGQKITGEKGAYRHQNCADLAIYPIPTAGRKPLDPNAPMSAGQVSLIGDLLVERHVTMGEASVIIDHLKTRPKRERSSQDQLAGNLRSVA